MHVDLRPLEEANARATGDTHNGPLGDQAELVHVGGEQQPLRGGDPLEQRVPDADPDPQGLHDQQHPLQGQGHRCPTADRVDQAVFSLPVRDGNQSEKHGGAGVAEIDGIQRQRKGRRIPRTKRRESG